MTAGTDPADAERGDPLLWRRVAVPEPFVATATVEGEQRRFGGDVRVGDLTGDGVPDLLVFRSADGGMKPCFFGAFTLSGDPLWRAGAGGDQPRRPGPVAVRDIDGDGAAEVVCLAAADPGAGSPTAMENAVLRVRDGPTGALRREAAPRALTERAGEGPNWVHHRLLLADLRGDGRRDLVVKLGDTVVAFDADLRTLWSYEVPWTEYPRHAAYVPAVGDVDGDGRDEVFGGHYLLDSDGTPIREAYLADHADSVAVTEFGGATRAVCSGGGHVLDGRGEVVVALGEQRVPHGQEVRVGDFRAGAGREMAVRYRGHEPDVLVADESGEVRARFAVEETPNNTGMETLRWREERDLLYDGGALFSGAGERVAGFGLPEPAGPAKQGWYHCIPADVCGDGREEAVVYNPWDDAVYVFTPAPLDEAAYGGYDPGPRQYNPRLMD
ncbi:MAG: hypothetical protein ABEH77_08945 [Halobacteriaceae archaeon]